MNDGLSSRFSTNITRAVRTSLVGAGLLLWMLCFLPPFATWAQRYEYVQATQYSAFSFLIPALLIIGAPWRWLGLASDEAPRFDDDGRMIARTPLRRIDRYVVTRVRHESDIRLLWFLLLFLVVNIFWRIAPVVDFMVRHGWVVVIESVSLVLVGAIFWTELVASPPLSPRTTRPYRVAMSVLALWALWILAYVDDMSRSEFYAAFHHVAGRGISASADQQIAAALLWFYAAIAFGPVIFWNLLRWLQSEENLTDELNRMIRRQRWIGP